MYFIYFLLVSLLESLQDLKVSDKYNESTLRANKWENPI